LQIKPDTSLDAEISIARTEMMEAAIATLADEHGETANTVRSEYQAAGALAKDRSDPQANTEHECLHMKAIAAQRKALAEIRAESFCFPGAMPQTVRASPRNKMPVPGKSLTCRTSGGIAAW
jgi:hypothetical protein